jgi:ribosome maturation factor RimP
LRDAVDGRRNWEGTLAGFGDRAVALKMEPGKTVRFPLDRIQKANLKFEW